MALKDNISHYYKLDGNSTDSVGSLNGTDTSITYSIANGKINQGAGFNGSSSFISFSSNPITSASTDYSISLWCNWTSLKNALSYNDNFNGTVVIGIGLRALNGTIRAVGFTNGVGGGEYSADSGITPNLGQWYHIVLTHSYNATSTLRVLKCYVDGVLRATASPGGGTVPGGGNTWQLGRTTTTFFSGKIDEVGFWAGRVLEADEVLKLYNGGLGLSYPFATGNFLPFFMN